MNGSPARQSEAGFTLLEMLVVLAITALVAGSALMLVNRRPPGLEIRANAYEIAAALRNARNQAILHNQETVVSVDVDRHQVWGDGTPVRVSLRKDFVIDLVAAAKDYASSSLGRIRFFPDGSSTGGKITLTYGPQKAIIVVDWLTGNATVSRP